MDAIETVSAVSNPVVAAQSTTPATTAKATGTTAAASTAPASSTAAATSPKKSFSELFDAAKKDLKQGETLTRVAHHSFARIHGGTQDEMCVNLSGNARNGETFDLIWRHGHCFHVYGGKGADHVVVEVGSAKKDATKTSSSSPSSSSSSSPAKTTAAASTAATGGAQARS